jgi:Acyl-coenzyme A oxidase N-terminal
LFGQDYEYHEIFKSIMSKHPELQATSEFYEMTREELMERSMKAVNKIVNDPEIKQYHQSKSLTTLMMDYMQGQVRSYSTFWLVIP